MYRPTNLLDRSSQERLGSSAKLMRLDVLLPTLDRAVLLERALVALLTAPIPKGLSVFITVINNRCTDRTADVVGQLMDAYPGRLRMIFERRRGKSRALNSGLAATDGDLVGMIDDDEVIDPEWFRVIYQAFQDQTLDFAGGPYLPDWGATPPHWVPTEYLAVLGAADSGTAAIDYSKDFPGILKGGNAVIRRRVLNRVGRYAEYLGPSGHARLLSCEDEDMYHRLLKHGARGRYLPSLLIYHHVSVQRLSPVYYRRWCFWRGVSRGLMDRAHRLPVPYLAGIPRFLHGRAARGLVRLVASRLRREPWEQGFAEELPLWDLAGYAWGRHVYTLARFSPVGSRRKLADPRAPADREVDTNIQTS
ncbi:MAG: glycosyltransferase [Acidobacteria bacterium]|nr:glycosyltransferase [Acidobacteriota bacterium]